ncbi:hypothetical protein HPB49_002931 [Dermacentor silvarum]|uniref:Uncharacterized protein n=1 Tax=Dermacentor silvarum TaxID=543639 RepID=A0ACB8CPE8_DERSI|nr:hypothetical protein HPB49_002931 [Dermacentor silvarum]
MAGLGDANGWKTARYRRELGTSTPKTAKVDVHPPYGGGTTNTREQPRNIKQRILRASKMPHLPKADTKSVPSKGARRSRPPFSTPLVERALDTIRTNNHQNIIVISTPNEANIDKYLHMRQLRINDQVHEVSVYETAPNLTTKGVIRRSRYRPANATEKVSWADVVKGSPKRGVSGHSTPKHNNTSYNNISELEHEAIAELRRENAALRHLVQQLTKEVQDLKKEHRQPLERSVNAPVAELPEVDHQPASKKRAVHPQQENAPVAGAFSGQGQITDTTWIQTETAGSQASLPGYRDVPPSSPMDRGFPEVVSYRSRTVLTPGTQDKGFYDQKFEPVTASILNPNEIFSSSVWPRNRGTAPANARGVANTVFPAPGDFAQRFAPRQSQGRSHSRSRPDSTPTQHQRNSTLRATTAKVQDAPPKELRSLRAEIQDLKTENVKLKSQLADTQPKRLTSNADIVPVPAVESPHTIQQSTPHKRKALEPITQATSSPCTPEGSVNCEALTQLQQWIERKLSEALDCKLAELLDASITKALERAMDTLLTAKLETLLLPRIELAFAATEKQRQEKMDDTYKAFQDMVANLAQNHNTRLTELENSLLRPRAGPLKKTHSRPDKDGCE